MEFREIAVFYDIKDDRRRLHFSNFLKNLGLERVQMSGFMGTIREDLIPKLIERCKSFEEDTVHVIFLYKCGRDSVKTYGSAYFPEDEDIVLF